MGVEYGLRSQVLREISLLTGNDANVSADSLVEVPCPLCGSKDFKKLFEAKDWVFGIGDDWFSVRRCDECSVGYVSPRPAEAAMTKYYPAQYYWSYEREAAPVEWETVLSHRMRQLEAKARVTLNMAPGRLLDVGAQKGEFIWFMRQRGWQAEGVELDNAVPNPQSLPIQYGDFLLMDLESASFDVVTAWAVLEHVYEPGLFVEKVATLLKPGGRFVVLVTNLNSIQSRLFRADDYPRHLTVFTRKSIRKLAERYGLRVVRSWTDQAVFGGALNGGLIYLVKRLGGYSASDAFQEWKQTGDPLLYWTQWHGKPSKFVLAISRLDRAMTWIPERLLDALGFGFNLTVVLELPRQSN